ncbi:MAG: hypothetical protein IJM30_07335 [Thermoguttaceae bacterium]|nr:hypothetical protein [Thermoguttaceae bacterium]
MNIRTKLLLTALVSLFALAFSSSASAQAPRTKVYMLFVWGTQTTETRSMVELSQRRVESAFEKPADEYAKDPRNYCAQGRLSYFREKFVAEIATLSGANASPINIKNKCEELAAKAGSNDAVFVYILCHGGVVAGRDGKKRHGLSPIADSVKDLDMLHKGIARDTIMKAISSKPHRLDVLITDACSVPLPSQLQNVVPKQNPGVRASALPYLAKFLINAEGTVNVNSSRPETPTKNSEEAMGLDSPNWRTPPSGDVERFEYERFAGTVFTNAFLKLAIDDSDYDPENGWSPEQFFVDLREKLDEQYGETLSHLRENSMLGAISKFKKQRTQTLTRFVADSLPNPDDLNYSSRRGSQRSGGSNSDSF